MSHRLFVRTGATVAAVAMAAMAAGPAFAAAPVAEASSSALQISIAGNSQTLGTYAVSNDGKKETTSGSNKPALNLVGGQTLLQVGTATQDAKTKVVNGEGISDACSSLAGDGSSLISTGNDLSCLTGGNALSLDAANIDLSKVNLLGGLTAGLPTGSANPTDALNSIPVLGSVLGSLPLPSGSSTSDPLSAVLQAILGPVSSGLKTLLEASGIAVTLDVGAVNAQCHATPAAATGSGSVSSIKLKVALPQPIGTLTIPVDIKTGENVHILSDLSDVIDAIKESLEGLITSLVNSGTVGSALGQILTPLGVGLDTVIGTLNDNLIDAIDDQLVPLEDTLLKGVVNETTHREGGRAIDITALNLEVLPAASAFIDGPLVGVKVASVSCGPNSTVTTTTTTTTDDDNDTPTIDEGTPTEVKSGIGSLEDAPSALAMAGLVGLVLAGTGAGIAGFRRSLRP